MLQRFDFHRKGALRFLFGNSRFVPSHFGGIRGMSSYSYQVDPRSHSAENSASRDWFL